MGRCHQCFGWRKEGPDERDQVLLNEARAIVEEARREARREAGRKTIALSFQELANATNNFRDIVGKGGLGAVYRGRLIPSGQTIAVKNLSSSGFRNQREFRMEAIRLSLLRHPNLVKLIGYCDQDDLRFLAYEFMSLGSLQNQLHDRERVGLSVMDWDTRMKIATGVAKGLDYLHNETQPPVIYRDLKSSNVLLGPGFHSKLSNFGLVKFRPRNDNLQASTSTGVEDETNGYFAPEYSATGNATIKSDVYSFGILLLELISGTRPPIEIVEGNEKHKLIDWARQWLDEPTKLIRVADLEMDRDFSDRCLGSGVEVALMCVEDDPERRPIMSAVVEALDYLTYWISATDAYNLEDCRNTPPANSVARQRSPTPRFPPAIEEEDEEDDSDEETRLLRRKPVNEREGTSKSKNDETWDDDEKKKLLSRPVEDRERDPAKHHEE